MSAFQRKIFTFDKITVFFKHTDYQGFVHAYNYMEWVGYVREAFFREQVPTFSFVLSQPIKMMTSRISCELFEDGVFGDTIEGQLTVSKIKKVSFDVIIRFFNKTTQKNVCISRHTLVFIDSRSQKFADIPVDLKAAVIQYDEDEK